LFFLIFPDYRTVFNDERQDPPATSLKSLHHARRIKVALIKTIS